MEIKYTIKVKDGHNAPEFRKGLGKGVVEVRKVEYKNVDIDTRKTQSHILDYKRQLLEEWFEVVAEVVDIKKERVEKLNKLNK